MWLFLGILIGVVIGAVVIYLAMERQVAQQTAALKALRHKLTQADAEHDRRIQAATERLQQDHKIQLTAAQSATQALQQKLTAVEADRDRLQEDYASHMRAAHADAAQQAQQQLAAVEADYNRRLKALTLGIEQDYEARLAAVQPYQAQAANSSSVTASPPSVPSILPSPEAPLPQSESLESLPLATSSVDPTFVMQGESSMPAIAEPMAPVDAVESAQAEPANIATPSPLAIPPQQPVSNTSQLQAKPVIDGASASNGAAHQASPPTVTAAANTSRVNRRSALMQLMRLLTVKSYAPESAVRYQAAKAAATDMSMMTTTEQNRCIPALKRLTRDSDPTVRLQAVHALSKIKPISKSLPLLRRALRDTDLSVVAAASKAMSRFKGYSPKPSPRKPHLPKNR
ncbi:MAG: HEAT repeat domain-containing protein [Cyanobacteria bacterium J06639_14]